MAKNKFPRTYSSLVIGKAVKNLKKLSDSERIQLPVKARLMNQADADKAIAKVTSQG